MDFREFVDLEISAKFLSLCSFFYIVPDFQKRFVSQEKVKNHSFATNFPEERGRENLLEKDRTVYTKGKKEQDRSFQSGKTHTILFLLLCYVLIPLGWPWPTPLAAVQEGPTLRCSPCTGAACRTFK